MFINFVVFTGFKIIFLGVWGCYDSDYEEEEEESDEVSELRSLTSYCSSKTTFFFCFSVFFCRFWTQGEVFSFSFVALPFFEIRSTIFSLSLARLNLETTPFLLFSASGSRIITYYSFFSFKLIPLSISGFFSASSLFSYCSWCSSCSLHFPTTVMSLSRRKAPTSMAKTRQMHNLTIFTCGSSPRGEKALRGSTIFWLLLLCPN